MGIFQKDYVTNTGSKLVNDDAFFTVMTYKVIT